jgi:hypothetical protein
MNYEIKRISPLFVFLNAVRIFLIFGLIIGIDYFFIRQGVQFGVLYRIAATLIFTVVYALVVAGLLAVSSWLYNVMAAKFKGVTVQLEQQP